ncbi:hypothetical protein [Sphingomonas nostoxanthinifaciens]|uniref:hypothetical protein n=1 Tax=Sphingomonas nostoxanthinifaciens TaxID=2872652 RepID=UPI001CC1CE93|nr:hypothetical protein [Sphingomonas nostoxanthinifaciens]UAK23638.1 hypothetical protein K8P63_14780 [Sphingomonas nostoxanthinifaciens]
MRPLMSITLIGESEFDPRVDEIDVRLLGRCLWRGIVSLPLVAELSQLFRRPFPVREVVQKSTLQKDPESPSAEDGLGLKEAVPFSILKATHA